MKNYLSELIALWVDPTLEDRETLDIYFSERNIDIERATEEIKELIKEKKTEFEQKVEKEHLNSL